ncbi:hypothetical protein [Streptomyces sp. NPDC052114]|uniref:hypothetical protein n=1 Tax=unclassified Streptomyces TaxID=2593676 RepID=UPI00341BBF78
MADEEGVQAHGEGSESKSLGGGEEGEVHPKAEFRMELRDSLPGDRAVIGVEREGEFMWLASRKYVHPQAVEEFVDQLQRIVREGMWVQNWTGR